MLLLMKFRKYQLLLKLKYWALILKHSKLIQILVDFIDACIVFNLDDDVIDKTIALRKLHRIKLPDAISAATTLVNGLDLISRNSSDFKNITGLKVIDPWNV